jgi:voltage-gated potassium channel
MFGRRRSEADLIAEGPRVAGWERRVEWPLTTLALLFLAGYAVEILKRPLPAAWHRDIEIATWVIWAAFAIDFVVRVVLARRHVRYAWRHVTDVLIIALPILRPLRLLRVVLLVRTLNRKMAESFGGSVIVYGGVVAGLICFCSSLAILSAERGHGGNIQTFGDALWWAAETVTTVGYGDRYPVTPVGRLVAVGLMVVGVSLIGVLTAGIAAWFLGQRGPGGGLHERRGSHERDEV